MKLFEVSWEVCNKVGGINTVLRSKAEFVQHKFGDDYFLIGPFFKDKSKGEFLQKPVPVIFKEVFERLKEKGIFCRFGTWLIRGNPSAILVELSDSFLSRGPEFKGKYWDSFRIDSLNSDFYDYDQPLLWSTAVGILIEEFLKANPKEQVLVHLHEWLAAGTGLYLNLPEVNLGSIISIVFTTHATTLGRAISGAGVNLYEIIEKINPDEEAYRLGVHTKHQTEKAIANTAKVFSTVSDITGYESKILLGRSPDIILPNGINPLPNSIEELLMKHKEFRDKMRYFLTYMFFPYYPIDLEQSLTFFLAARYEFKAKGIDLYIDALTELDKKLRETKSKKTIFAFIFVPAGGKAIKEEIVENREVVNDFSDKLFSIRNLILDRLLRSILAGKDVSCSKLLPKDIMTELKKLKVALQREGLPPVITHYIPFEDKDAILIKLKQNGLLNDKESKVKVIFYPIYLTGKDGLLNLDYSETIIGSHFGIFPSIYEPWGYTPVETAMRAVPAVTSDLSGFGKYLIDNNLDGKGIFVLRLANKSYEEQVKELSEVMFKFSTLKRDERIEHKIEAYQIALKFSWALLIENYFKAYDLALNNVG
ncbi:MAG: glycogen synthase [Candidatus Woesearchaeota archaeon]|nr:glycogen synthase [Candidatus Woesearchaeota archaeon]MDN5327652.1 glycogen synthase [Candidatus Woesearchaeota archaeon]